MRFVKIVIKNFRAIESAEVEFGPGLNVLFGPNDLGKSTLVCAIRAALLVQPSSTEGSRYSSWFVDAVPEVTLTFTDDDNHFWRVRKCFGSASIQATADLYHSKDGRTFTRDCGNREVEDRVRTLIGWGIPSPGGKGAPRGLPTSFLAQVLLAGQTDVETILAQSTEEDGAVSGKDRLRKALAALAEDPWFKRVLTATQKRVDEFFTPTGQRKRGRGSPFALAADDLKRRAEKIDNLKKEVVESRATEEQVRRLHDQHAAAREECDEGSAALTTLRRMHARARERAVAEATLEGARSAMHELDQQAAAVAESARGVTELESATTQLGSDLATARAVVEGAEAVLRGAEEALRSATSEDGAHQREVTQAKLREERAELGARTGRVEKRLNEVEAAQRAVGVANAANQAKLVAESDLEKARAEEGAAKRELADAEERFNLARGTLAYGQWYAADAAAKEAIEAQHGAESSRAEAVTKEAAAQETESRAAAMGVELTARRALLPDLALTRRLEELKQMIGRAEAALGGGFSLTVRGAGKVPVHITLDGSEVVAGTVLEGRLVFDAERTSTLRLGDLIDLEIVAGAADKRAALATLRERWANETPSIFERAGVTDLEGIRQQLEEVSGIEAATTALRGEATHLRMAAEAALQSADMKQAHADSLRAIAVDSESLKAKLASMDLQLLATSFAQLAKPWRAQAESVVAAKERAVTAAREQSAAHTRQQDMAAYQVMEAGKNAVNAAAEAGRALAAVGFGGQPAQTGNSLLESALSDARVELGTLHARHAAIGAELGSLEQEASLALAAAKAAVEEAKVRRDSALERQGQAAKALEEARSEFHMALGEAEALRRALDNADRAGAEAAVADATASLRAYASDPAVSTEEVAAAEHCEAETRAKLDQLRAELNQAEGALTKVGGVGLREELAREEEANVIARDRQRELEVDADAWHLLRDTLSEVEKESSTHLGRALATPVSERLIELTQGRYGGLRFDQHLKAETVEVPLVATAEGVLEALSVGTRDQVATLLRLTVAEQLKSALVLDDHLVHTDPDRLEWFRDTLKKTALITQVIVFTCRAHDYLAPNEYPNAEATRDLAGGTLRAIDASRALRRFDSSRPRLPPAQTPNDAPTT